DFQKWRNQEERAKGIEFALVNTYHGMPEFLRQCRYVCSRAGTGGSKQYDKLHPTWTRKRGAKRTECKCVLLVKQYPGLSTILGSYTEDHDHPLGTANLPFTRIPKETREYIAGMLRFKMAPEHILKLLHDGVYNQDRLFDPDLDDGIAVSRTEFIELRDIRKIQKEIEAETVQLHPDDGQSVLKWVERLRAKDHLLGFKSRTDPPPTGSGIPPDTFLLMIQTKWQRDMFAKYGEPLLCIDATHNVT
ncbi:hypothetical protein DFH09DRAFT_833175, partial [Mycena vulgaris]